MTAKTPHLIFFGGNRFGEDGPMLVFARAARNRGVESLVVTERWHLDLKTADGLSFGTQLETENIRYMVLEELNVQNLANVALPGTWGLMINCIWIARREIVDLFGGRLFNYHNARLPEERGAAAYSWRILSGEPDGAVNIHQVTKSLDDGDILISRPVAFPANCRTPADHYRFLAPIEENIFGEFLNVILSDEPLVLSPQDESRSRYWPRLNTDLHGYIDWQWSATAVCRFIDAFSDPFEGAMTYWNETRVHLKGSHIDRDAGDFHPFQAGLVFRNSEQGLSIAVPKGAVVVSNVTDDDGILLNNRIRPGARLFTPTERLTESMGSRSVQHHDRTEIR